MAPLDTNRFVTCWLPLQRVPAEAEGGSGLVFAAGSHRDTSLLYWHGDPAEDVDASARDYTESVASALDVGDATWHDGWTLHCASPNMLSTSRRALAISYFADGATTRLRRDAKRTPHGEDAESYAAWIDAVKPGAPARHALLPLAWDAHKGGAQQIAPMAGALRLKARPAQAAAAASKKHKATNKKVRPRSRRSGGGGGGGASSARGGPRSTSSRSV